MERCISLKRPGLGKKASDPEKENYLLQITQLQSEIELLR
jgi:hypothetical protein